MELPPIGATGYAAAGDASALLVLAHGAGAGQRHPFMVSLAQALAANGVAVMTFDFPYIRAGRKVPDRAPVLEAAFGEAIAVALDWAPRRPLFIGGKSMGGRMATHLGAQGVSGLTGIIALGYPLHPPGRPDQPRVAHLPAITAPVLIVQGQRDAFGTPDELRPVVKTMTAPVTLHVITGGDHSFVVRGRRREEVNDEVVKTITGWMADR